MSGGPKLALVDHCDGKLLEVLFVVRHLKTVLGCEFGIWEAALRRWS